MDQSYSPSPEISVSIVLIGQNDGALGVVLTQCREEPFSDQLALPTTSLFADETFQQAARRELSERTGIVARRLDLIGVFADPKRDPRRRTVSVALVGAAHYDEETFVEGDRPGAGGWYLFDDPKTLAMDHWQIANAGLSRLKRLALDKPVAAGLLRQPFTLAEFQSAQETLLGKRFDTRNFRREILASGWLEQAGKERRGAHRPAQLYTAIERDPLADDPELVFDL